MPQEDVAESSYKSIFLRPLVIGAMVLHAVAFFVSLLTGEFIPTNDISVAVVLLIYVLVYYLNRFNYSTLAAYVFCILFNAELFIGFIINLNLGYPTLANLMSNALAISVILGGMLISRQAIWYFTGINVLLVVGSYFVVLQNTLEARDLAFPNAAFIIFFALIAWLYQRSLNKAQAETKSLLIEVQQKNKELTRLDTLKDEFLANTSHELRTPLNGIIGLAESLLDGATGQLSPATQDNLQLIMNSGRRLARLVNDILDISKLRHEDLTITPKPVHMHGVTDVVMALSKPLIGPKKLELINAIDQDIPLAQADEDRIQQIMYNLIGNAIKFTPAGTVTVTAEPQANFLAITVSDTGIGIPLDAQAAIFELFEQVDGSIEREHGGTGLGLAVTKQLVELHGGRISVKSTPGTGSHFTFTLPLADKAAQVPPPSIEVASAYGFTPFTAENQSSHNLVKESQANPPGRILIVDDEEVNRRVALNHLSTEGYDVVLAADGREAFELLNEYTFDLVLLDIMMPYMSGLTVCKELRGQYSASELPILMVTAKNQVSDLVEGYNAGANDYLTKPFSKNELIARIKTHIELSSITRNLEHLVAERTAELEELVQELDLFSRTVAHDLKTPLGGVIGYGEILAEEQHEMDDAERLDLINSIIRSGFRMRSIIDGLLMLARTRSKHVETTPLNMAQIIQDAEDRFAFQIQQRSVTFDIQPNIPNAYGEPTWIAEVLANYISNAIKYGGDPPHIQIGADELPNDMVRYWVKDNGEGIPQEKQATIFTPFTRLNHNHKTDSHGLGLSIVERIISRLGGEVGLESELGRGSTFYFTLPQATETVPQTQDVFL